MSIPPAGSGGRTGDIGMLPLVVLLWSGGRGGTDGMGGVSGRGAGALSSSRLAVGEGVSGGGDGKLNLA